MEFFWHGCGREGLQGWLLWGTGRSFPCISQSQRWAGGHLKETAIPWETHAGAGFLQDLWPCGRPWMEQFLNNCSPWEGDPCWRSLWWTVSHGKDPMLEQVWGALPRGGRSGREHVWWTKHNPIPHPPYAIWDEAVKIVSELKPGKKGGVEERWFQYLGLFLINLFWSDG